MKTQVHMFLSLRTLDLCHLLHSTWKMSYFIFCLASFNYTKNLFGKLLHVKLKYALTGRFIFIAFLNYVLLNRWVYLFQKFNPKTLKFPVSSIRCIVLMTLDMGDEMPILNQLVTDAIRRKSLLIYKNKFYWKMTLAWNKVQLILDWKSTK